MSIAEWAVIDGEILPSDDLSISPLTSGVYYGTGCFETFVADHLRFFRFDDHIERLNEGIRWLTGSDKHDQHSSEIRKQIVSLVHHNKLAENRLRVRVQVMVNDSAGYAFQKETDISTLITLHPIKQKKHVDGGLSLQTAATRVIPASCKPAHLKLSNMLHYRRAFREAVEQGGEDALMLTTNGAVAETSIANIFWKRGDTVFTPSEKCDILPGITRSALIDLIRKRINLPVEEGQFSPDELFSADTVWITNSVKGVHMVESIDGRNIPGDTEFETKLKSLFQQMIDEDSRS